MEDIKKEKRRLANQKYYEKKKKPTQEPINEITDVKTFEPEPEPVPTPTPSEPIEESKAEEEPGFTEEELNYYIDEMIREQMELVKKKEPEKPSGTNFFFQLMKDSAMQTLKTLLIQGFQFTLIGGTAYTINKLTTMNQATKPLSGNIAVQNGNNSENPAFVVEPMIYTPS